MRNAAFVVAIAFLVLVGAAFVLFLGWILSLGLGGLLGFSNLHAFAMAMAALLIVVIFAHAMITHTAAEAPWRTLFDHLSDNEIEAEDKDISQSESWEWFRSCPCGSNKPFARCCGKRAFNKQRKVAP
jgi:hypothetical protein